MGYCFTGFEGGASRKRGKGKGAYHSVSDPSVSHATEYLILKGASERLQEHLGLETPPCRGRKG